MNLLSTYANDLVARLNGPLHFRFFVQPLMAMLLAVRDGARDARQGRTAYAWALFTQHAKRQQLIAHGWQSISKVFLLACVLDVVYQLLAWHRIRPLQVLLTASILAVLPYVLLRGPVNRLWRMRRARASG